MTGPEVLVFDVNQTLIDIDSLAPVFDDVLGDGRAVREWFNQLILYSMTVTLSECYVDFFSLGRAVLLMMADVHRKDVGSEQLDRLTEMMSNMPAHADVADGLTVLRDKGFRLVTLTNSPKVEGRATPLDNAGLAEYFEQLSVASIGQFKPAPAVYHHACHVLDVAPTDCMMVAAHGWDLIGAQHVGFSSAFVTRSGSAPLRVEGLPQPTLVVRDVRELAQRLDSP